MSQAKLTPMRRRFLQIAIEQGGEIELTRGESAKFCVGAVSLTETSGRALQSLGLIERVLVPGTHRTEAFRTGPTGIALSYRYRVTDAGRAAVQ